MKNRRKIGFSLETLEDRTLMSVSTSEYINKFGATMRSGGMVSPMMYYPPTISVQDPLILLNGVSVGSIGGEVMASVKSSDPNYKIKSVEYDVTGAVSSSTWVWNSLAANHTSTTGVIRNFNGTTNPYITEDSFSWFWDENPGSRTIKVIVTFNDPNSTVKSKEFTVGVNAPVIDSTKLTGNAIVIDKFWENKKQIGILGYNANATPSDGVFLTSVVTSTPSNGIFSYVQTASKFNYNDESVNDTHVLVTPKNTTMLDVPVEAENSININDYQKYLSQFGPPHATYGIAINHEVTDTPLFVSPIVTDVIDPHTLPYSMSIDFSFDTYLIWTPVSGIPIAVDHIQWNYNADATYDDGAAGMDDADIRNKYLNPANWTIMSNRPTGPWTKTGDKQRSILKWSNNTVQVRNGLVTTIK